MRSASLRGIELREPVTPEGARLLVPDALALVALLERETRDRRGALLLRRLERQAAFAAGIAPTFLSNTRKLRASDWRIAAAGDRRARTIELHVAPRGDVAQAAQVEQAVASGVRRIVIDGEDAGARATELATTAGATSAAEVALRLRSWQRVEPAVVVDGRPVAGAIVDLALDLFHHARVRLDEGRFGGYLLSRLESHLEARLWKDLFALAADVVGLPRRALTATIAIETLPALFEIDELLWELEPHGTALLLGRTALAASALEKLRADDSAPAPDFDALLAAPALRAAARQVVATGRRRGVATIAGPPSPSPRLDGSEPDGGALERFAAELADAAALGFDGVALADAAHVELATRRFLDAARPLGTPTTPPEDDLLAPAAGERTGAGLESSLAAALRTVAARLAGEGRTTVAGRVEDGASLELRAALLARWVRDGAPLDDGRPVTAELFRERLAAHAEALRDASAVRAAALLDVRVTARGAVPLAEAIDRALGSA